MKKSITYTYGMYYALLSIGIILGMYLMNITEKNLAINLISVIGSVLIFYFGIKTFKTNNNNILSLSNALKLGLGIALIGGLISAVYMYIHLSFIQPDFVEKVQETAMQTLREVPNMTDEQMAMAKKTNAMMTTPFSLSTFSLMGNLLFGVIISLVLGLIMKQSPQKA